MCVALGGRLAEEIINGKDNVATGACKVHPGGQKQMVMSLGMSPEIGQGMLGGQQSCGPFMGRDFMGQGAPPISQALKEEVDDEVKRIVDEQYQCGMKLLRDNMYLLDELAKMLIEQEKSGEELMKLINKTRQPWMEMPRCRSLPSWNPSKRSYVERSPLWSHRLLMADSLAWKLTWPK